MKFCVIHQQTSHNAHCPRRVVEQTTDRGIGWVNRYLDREYVRRIADTTLRTYAHNLLHFVRWWESVHHTSAIVEGDLTESTLLEYVRFQSSQQPRPSPSTINDRVAVAERAIRNEFPDAPCQIARGFHQAFLRRRPMGLGRPRVAMSRLRVKVPKRNIVPLSVDEVARFWSSFRTSRDLAIVGLMLLQGLRSAEVLALNRDDALLSEAQLRVPGKGNKFRFLPLAPETVQLLEHYLRLERPNPCSAALFVSLKGRARVALSPETTRHYRGTAHNFLSYLAADHPEVQCLEQLRREPHILGWMSRLHSQVPPLVTASYILRLIALRGICNELAWTEQLSELAHLIRREDIPRLPQRLPRPLTPEQDELLQQELRLRNDLGSNVFLLIRHTGMRIGECADLSFDCLRSTGSNQWAVHVPLGKLKTERMVPVDSFVCELVRRLQFFRSLDPLPVDGRLLARPRSKEALVRQLRDYLHQVCHALGLPTRIVPHQFRHRYASEMLRAGVGFPVLMKLLGHTSPEMTMRYLDVALTDLQREFQLARAKPRHLAPQPRTPFTPRAGLDGLIDSLLATQHMLEMFRRTLPNGTSRRRLDRLSNRLTKILSEARKLGIP